MRALTELSSTIKIYGRRDLSVWGSRGTVAGEISGIERGGLQRLYGLWAWGGTTKSFICIFSSEAGERLNVGILNAICSAGGCQFESSIGSYSEASSFGDAADLRLIPTKRGGSTIEEVAVGTNPRPGTYMLAPRSDEPLLTEGENRTTPRPNDPRRRLPGPSSEEGTESSVVVEVLLVVRDGEKRQGDITGLA